jgi:putative NIF3 family GTP cyclohydrolase 1 type 2
LKATPLYERLEHDFIAPGLSDDWTLVWDSIADLVTPNFKDRSMGLVCDFADHVDKVYTAVFPSIHVCNRILADNTADAMLFVHHPAVWDIRQAPQVFTQMNRTSLLEFRKRRISVYNLHVPLDNFGEYSTSVSFARALEIEPIRPFAPYHGGMAGVYGRTGRRSIQEMKAIFENKVGHPVHLYHYGADDIRDGLVAVIAGGGLSEAIREIAAENINTFISGITVKNTFSSSAHAVAEEHGINVLGGTHYSTEMFACISMVEYFRSLGLPSEFISDEPIFADM